MMTPSTEDTLRAELAATKISLALAQQSAAAWKQSYDVAMAANKELTEMVRVLKERVDRAKGFLGTYLYPPADSNEKPGYGCERCGSCAGCDADDEFWRAAEAFLKEA